MAGTMTHAFFAEDIAKRININKDYINNLKTFSQGHDMYFFLIKKRKNGKKIGNYFHKHETQKFFINMINYIKDNHLYNDDEIKSYLYGYINHYILDKNIHPYVRYKTGVFKKKRPETYKYNSKHANMENYIDAYLIYTRENILPGKYKSQNCLKPNKFSNNLKDLIDYTFLKTYDFKNASKKYEFAIHNACFEYALLRNDSFGIKRKIYSFVDKFTSKKAYKFEPVSLAYKIGELDEVLNLDHKQWNHPMDKKETYNTSFFDIYNNSLDEAVNTINKVNDYFNNKKIDLTKLFDNTSFSTGKDCNDKRKEQYFEI